MDGHNLRSIAGAERGRERESWGRGGEGRGTDNARQLPRPYEAVLLGHPCRSVRPMACLHDTRCRQLGRPGARVIPWRESPQDCVWWPKRSISGLPSLLCLSL
ncbi:hypothetical protein BHE74_00053665 [Ensete ventricosum]|nr:hypothetical protein BHE74_00053665 [Ensete ventricosum]